jgi:hypothetical protein
METAPHNACDYRCERCLETERCAVFRLQSERKARNFALGRDTEGIEAALRDVGEIFEETKEMLLEKAKEFDIDLEALTDDEPLDIFEEAKKDLLYQRSFEFTMKTHALLKKIGPLVTPESQVFFDDIEWHHTVVSAKVFRAIGSDDEPEIRLDAVNSAAVAIKSLTICIMAFDTLASRYPEISEACKGFSKTAREIKQAIRDRFPAGSRDPEKQ